MKIYENQYSGLVLTVRLAAPDAWCQQPHAALSDMTRNVRQGGVCVADVYLDASSRDDTQSIIQKAQEWAQRKLAESTFKQATASSRAT